MKAQVIVGLALAVLAIVPILAVTVTLVATGGNGAAWWWYQFIYDFAALFALAGAVGLMLVLGGAK